MSLFEIRKTENKGQGLYSLGHFSANQVILKFNGKILDKTEAYALPDDKSELFLQVGKNKYLDLKNDVSLFINHSCNPNTTVKILSHTAFLVAMRYILPNEELCFDYALTSTEPESDWTMVCSCGEWNCRKKISGFKSLSEADKIKYEKFTPKYVK